jgi:signal transduction histidine kinase/ligand-binding sensor domain-containing protein
MDLYTRSDGLSGNTLSSLLEDREGSIWVAAVDGVDRFRDYAVSTLSIPQGLSSNAVASVVAEEDGVWLGTDDGLNEWRNGEVTVYRRRSPAGVRRARIVRTEGTAGSRIVRQIGDDELPVDSVDSLYKDSRGQIWVMTSAGVAILESGRFRSARSVPAGLVLSVAEDRSGIVWLSHQKGLFALRDARVVERRTWAQLGLERPATSLLGDAQHGLWLGFRDGGVAYFNNGQLTAPYATGDAVNDLHLDATGTLWAATDGGLRRIKDSVTLSSRNGLPCNVVHWMIEGNDGSVWLYMACGLVRIARSDFDAWIANPKLTIQPTVFDRSDGVRSQQFHFGYNSVAARGADGKIWFVPFGGVSVIDPKHLPTNALPPPIQIERVTADREVYDAARGLRLPPLVRDLQIDYTALSFVAPEKNRFRVKLDGRDRDWQDVGTRRQAFYTDLAPGTYQFRVQGSNSSGVWNETGASLAFSIAPAYYQTPWFKALVVAMAFAVLWAAYLVRVRQVARAYQRRLDERVNERTRIARELHDTLLQSFHGVLLRFQTASYLLAERPAEAKDTLDAAIDQAAKAITEGRDAVQGLRTSTLERNDLAMAIKTLGDQLATDAGAGAPPPTFSVAVEGETRNLHPIVRDDIYKIAAEALRNAFRHAHARRVEVEIRYDDDKFRLRVRDDGRGIDREVLARQGVEGHFGLRGMPERAALIGGKLAVWSEVGAGTEVELQLPARIVYPITARRSWLSRLVCVQGARARSRKTLHERHGARLPSTGGRCALHGSSPCVAVFCQCARPIARYYAVRASRLDLSERVLEWGRLHNRADA